MGSEEPQRLNRADQRWLLGADYARLARGGGESRMVKRESRWLHAKKSLPVPAVHGASQHVSVVFYTWISPRLETEGWRDFARKIVKQPQWWYDAACLMLAQSYAEQHVTSCQKCRVEDWTYLLTVEPRLPNGTEFDPEGNTKPPKEEA